ncbi:MAG: hypothetical protein ACLRWP_09835 [Bilophila wadsworthia]
MRVSVDLVGHETTVRFSVSRCVGFLQEQTGLGELAEGFVESMIGAVQ